jgi:hypothetical protein
VRFTAAAAATAADVNKTRPPGDLLITRYQSRSARPSHEHIQRHLEQLFVFAFRQIANDDDDGGVVGGGGGDPERRRCASALVWCICESKSKFS